MLPMNQARLHHDVLCGPCVPPVARAPGTANPALCPPARAGELWQRRTRAVTATALGALGPALSSPPALHRVRLNRRFPRQRTVILDDVGSLPRCLRWQRQPWGCGRRRLAVVHSLRATCGEARRRPPNGTGSSGSSLGGTRVREKQAGGVRVQEAPRKPRVRRPSRVLRPGYRGSSAEHPSPLSPSDWCTCAVLKVLVRMSEVMAATPERRQQPWEGWWGPGSRVPSPGRKGTPPAQSLLPGSF